MYHGYVVHGVPYGLGGPKWVPKGSQMGYTLLQNQACHMRYWQYLSILVRLVQDGPNLSKCAQIGQISPFETINGPFWTMNWGQIPFVRLETRSEGRNRPSKGVPKMACFGPYFGPYFGGSWRVLGQDT